MTVFLLALLVGQSFAQQQQLELTVARQLWQFYNTTEYYYHLATPYSPDPATVPATRIEVGVFVTDDAVTEFESINISPDDTTIIETIPTINTLFDMIQMAIDSTDENPSISVTYNNEFGYPQEFSIVYPDDGNVVVATTATDASLVNPRELVGAINDFLPTSVRSVQLATAKSTWKIYNYQNYDMVYQRFFFITPPFNSKLSIEVRDGVGTSVVVVDSQEDVTNLFDDDVPTIDKLFTDLETSIQNTPVGFTVQYSWPVRYPVSGSIDSSTIAADDEYSFEVFEFIPFNQQPLDDARALWNSFFGAGAGTSTTYAFSYEKACFCDDEYIAPRWVRVEDGVVESVKNNFGADVSDDIKSDTPSIESLFDTIQDAIDNDAFSMFVAYDKTYGYPTRVDIDRSEFVADGDDEVSVSIDKFNPIIVYQAELDTSKALWSSQGYTEYTYNFLQSCFTCPTEPSLVSVENGQVVMVDGQPVTADTSSPPTINELFDEIQKGLNENAYEVTVSYDPDHGFPKQIYIDEIKNAFDDEYSVTISNFMAPPQGDDNGNGNGNGDNDNVPSAAPTSNPSASPVEDSSSPCPFYYNRFVVLLSLFVSAYISLLFV